jgi:hypothetical protein
MPQDDVALKLRSAQIEKSKPETQLFSGQIFIACACHGNRRRDRGAHHRERRRAYFDIARREVGIAHGFRSCDDVAFDQHDSLLTECRRSGAHVRRACVGIERHLNDSGAVAKVDERESTKVAASMDPAAEPDVLTGVFEPEGTAKVCTMEGREMVGRHHCGNQGARRTECASSNAVALRPPLGR